MLAALGKGAVILKGALWSEDTEAMVDCMQRLSLVAAGAIFFAMSKAHVTCGGLT